MTDMRLFPLLLVATLISCPTEEPRPDEGTLPGECSDGADNDDDDLFDCADPDCAGAPVCAGDDDDATDDDDAGPGFPIAFATRDYTDVLDLAVGFYGK